MSCCCALSTQEKILQDKAAGKENPNRAKHQRLFDILETFDGMAPIIGAAENFVTSGYAGI